MAVPVLQSQSYCLAQREDCEHRWADYHQTHQCCIHFLSESHWNH